MPGRVCMCYLSMCVGVQHRKGGVRSTLGSHARKAAQAGLAEAHKDGVLIPQIVGISSNAYLYTSHRRYDVLFMTEPLDELTVQSIGEYGGKPLTDLGKENVEFSGDEEEKAKKEEQSTDTQGEKPVCAGSAAYTSAQNGNALFAYLAFRGVLRFVSDGVWSSFLSGSVVGLLLNVVFFFFQRVRFLDGAPKST